MKKKRYSGLVLCMAVTAAVLAGCGQKEQMETDAAVQTTSQEAARTTAQNGSKTDEKETGAVYGKVDALEGEDGVVIKLGKPVESPNAETGAFKENGETKTLRIGKDVRITAENQGKAADADFYSLSEGTLLKIGFDGETPVSVEILNDDLVLFADQIKAAFAEKDIEALDSLVSYPFYFTKADGTGLDIADKEALVKARDDIFAAELTAALASFDTSSLSSLGFGFTIGSETGSPSVQFDRFRGGKLKIAMINAAK